MRSQSAPLALLIMSSMSWCDFCPVASGASAPDASILFTPSVVDLQATSGVVRAGEWIDLECSHSDGWTTAKPVI